MVFNGFGTPFSSQVGPCWRQLGHVGASWGSFWRSWAPSWLQGGPPDAPQRLLDPPRLQFFLNFLIKSFQKWFENLGKWRSGGSGSLWVAPGGHLGAKMAPKSAKRSLKRGVDGQLGAKMWQLGSKMGSQIHRKNHQKNTQKLNDFLHRFFIHSRRISDPI